MRLYTKLTDRQLGDIAEEIGVELYQQSGRGQKAITRGRNAGKTLYTFTLRPDKSTADADGNCRHQRESSSPYGNGRKVHAVCWHGHADFMTLVYIADSTARFETAFATYENAADFAKSYTDTAFRNIGSMMYPVSAASACRCGFADTANHAQRGALAEI